MKSVLLGLLALLPVSAYAHPVPYAGAIGVMSWNQPFMSDDWITYSFRHDTAIAARHMRFDMPEGRAQFYAPQIDYLAKRWNNSDSQANIYTYGSYGAMSFKNSTMGAGLAGIDADAESRKLFVSAKYEHMWARSGPTFWQASFRVGAAPYEAEFNEIASWFMIQYDVHPMLTRKFALTPLFRAFYKSFLFEGGVSTQGDWMLNFMFHF